MVRYAGQDPLSMKYQRIPTVDAGTDLDQFKRGGLILVVDPINSGTPLASGSYFVETITGVIDSRQVVYQVAESIVDGKEYTRFGDGNIWNTWTERGTGGGGGGSTDLSVTGITSTQLTIASSTGTDATIDSATAVNAGLLSATDKAKLDGIADGADVFIGTDLAIGTHDADSIDITSSTGADITLPQATTSLAGLMSAADKTSLDSLVTDLGVFADNVFQLHDNTDSTKKAVFELSGIATGVTRTISIPNATGTIVLTGNTGTLQNKTLDNTNTINVKTGNFTIEDSTTATKKIIFDVSNVTATRTVVIPSDNNITLVGTSLTQTLTNKTLGNTNTFVLKDSATTFEDNSDTSKKMVFELSGITTATTRTLTVPNASGTIALAADVSQTLGFTATGVAGIYPNGDTDTGLASNAANTLMLMTGGTARLWMGTSGEIAIGATSKVGFSLFGVKQTATGNLSEAIAVSKTIETSGTPNNNANGLIRFFDPTVGSIFSFGAYDRSGDRVLEFATANDFDILFTSSGVTLMTVLEDGSSADFAGQLRCDSFRIDATPTASSATTTHKLAVSLNGTTYYLLLSNV